MTTIYVQNRSPHRILKDMTPEEAFSGKKPNVENLRIFGCPVYSHIPKDKRNKLEPSGKKGIFVGYSDSSKAYRIYIPKQHKIEVSRDVMFNERMAFRKSIEETMKALMNDQGLSMYLWGEATMTTIYVQYKSPHRILKDMTPEESF